MTALWCELRNRRLWAWVVVVTVARVSFPFAVSSDRWIDSWYGVSVWISLPVLYVGAFIAAAAADLDLERHRGTLTTLVSVTARPAYLPRVTTWIARGITLVVLPQIVTTIVLVSVAAGSPTNQSLMWSYQAISLALGFGFLACGVIVGALTASRVMAPLLAAVIAFGIFQYIEIIPIVIKPWLMPHPTHVALIMCAVVLIMVSGELLHRVRDRVRQGKPRRGLVATASVVLVSAAATFGAGELLPSEQLRPLPGDGACLSTNNGNLVCAWRDDHHLLATWRDMAHRYEDLTAHLPPEQQHIMITEPQLALPDDDATVITVEPLEQGDNGHYMVAQTIANSLVATCDTTREFTQDEEARHIVLTIGILDVATTYLSELPAPPYVVSPGDDTFDAAHAVVTDVLARDQADQLEWIHSALTERNELCAS